MAENNSIDSIWQTSSVLSTLKDNQVHLWCANLALSASKIEQLTSLLSPDELARANKFRFPRHRKRFIAARGVLRRLLGSYISKNPQSLKFTYRDRGKPQLKEDLSLQFNLSHSQEYALFGFTLERLIGVDLEYQREMPDALKIAQRFFSPREYQLLEQVPKEQQPQLFFQLWTAKEAYLKAIGTGLSGSLAAVEIAFDQSQSPYLAVPPGEEQTPPWSLHSCSPATNYLGAIAINGQIPAQNINYWRWSADLF